MENSVNNANQFYFLFRHWKNLYNGLKSDNVEITIGNETDDIVKELFESFKKKIL